MYRSLAFVENQFCVRSNLSKDGGGIFDSAHMVVLERAHCVGVDLPLKIDY